MGTTESYKIRVRGCLGPEWSAWFAGLGVRADGDGCTTISGAVADQAALHGLLTKIRDLGLPLISVEVVEDTATASLSELSEIGKEGN